MNLPSSKSMPLWIDRFAVFLIFTLAFIIPISEALIEILATTLIGLFVLRMILDPPDRGEVALFFRQPLFMILLAFYVVLGLSIFNAGALWEKGLRAWFSKWGEWLALFGVISYFLKPRYLKPLLTVIFISSLVVCLDGFWQKAAGTDLLRHYPLIQTQNFTAVTASFGQYNNLGAYLAVSFFIASDRLVHRAGRLHKLIAGLGLLFILITLGLSYSRGSWLAVAAASTLVILISRSSRERLYYAGFIAVLLALIFSAESLRERALYLIKSGGDEQRIILWKAALTMAGENPWLGKGLNTFMSHLPLYLQNSGFTESRFFYQHAHNSYLQIFAESGVFALQFFALFLFLLIMRGIQAVKSGQTDAAMPVFAAFAAIAVHAFFDNDLYSLKLSALYWFLAALVFILSTGNCTHSEHSS